MTLQNFSLTKLKQMEWNSLKHFPDYIAEPKLDGMRIIAVKEKNRVRLLRENGIDRTESYPEVVSQIQSDLPDDTILDGELCVLSSKYTADFTKLQTRNTTNSIRIRILKNKIPATFVAFDTLKFEGNNLINEVLSDRKTYLNKLQESDRLQRVEMFKPDEIESKIRSMQGAEGIVLKDPTKSYTKSKWIKIKNWHESDFKVVGFTSEVKMISALELNDQDGNYVGKVNYTGYPQSEEMAKSVVGMTAVVKYLPTVDYNKLRFPILKELRK